MAASQPPPYSTQPPEARLVDAADGPLQEENAATAHVDEAMDEQDDTVQSSHSSDDQDPDASIEPFDWQQLEEDYHGKIEALREEEQGLYDRFNQLIEYFGVWAGVTQNQELGRSFMRLRTRMYHVKHSEAELEQKRQHYIQVVEAFQSALRLLNGP